MPPVETVTILMTDLVGSTDLATSVGPAAAEQLRRDHFELLRETVEAHGGREVKNLGDGLMVAFSSASSAAACAVRIQQGLELRNRRAEEQLVIRIGISTGDATSEDDDYFGMPVVEAARLCNAASAGQILATDLIAHLTAGRGDHAFEPVGALELKGLPGPLRTVKLAWEPLGEMGSVPLPSRLQEIPLIGFVGRAGERDRLQKLFESACDGGRRLALISGEPGIGKTRLAMYAALEARASGATILYGRCEEDLGAPYGPWVEALGHYVEHAPKEVLDAHAERHGGELTRLVPKLGDRLGSLPAPRQTEPDSERYLLWGAVGGLLGEASNQEPIVFVLDDLQWADKPTLLLLKHVVAQDSDGRMLFVGTYRESDLARGHPLSDVLADLHREQGVERLMLRGLEEPDVVTIMELTAGQELDDPGIALSHELFRETDGNPFYIAEILRHLVESEAIYERGDGRWSVRSSLEELGLPQSVHEVVGRRVERLGEKAVKALSVAAVIGQDFDAKLLSHVIESSEDALLDLLEGCVKASVLTESADVPGRFSFAHALVNHTLYDGLGTTRRARLHSRVAEALEELSDSDSESRLSELAYHWAEAMTAVDVTKAIRYARRAAERALLELAPDEALRWSTQALELLTQEPDADPAERCDILIGLGEAQRQVGQPAFRETLLEASRLAVAIGDAERAALAALSNNRGPPGAFGDVDQERLVALEQAVVLDQFANRARCARLISLQALERLFEPDHKRRRALGEKALALARGAGDSRTLAYVLYYYVFALWAPDTLAERLALTEELIERARALSDPALEIWAAVHETNVFAESGDLERADAALERCRSLTDQLGQPTLRWFAIVTEGCRALLRGELDRAEELSESALQLGSASGQLDAPMIYGAQLFSIRVYAGRADEVVELLEEGVKANPRIPAFRAGLAVAYCWVGRTESAAALLEEAAKDGFDHVPNDQARATALALYADATFQANVPEVASVLYELVEPWSDQVVWNAASAYGHGSMYRAMLSATLGFEERADEDFAGACEFQERKGMLLWVARARLAWGEALARRGAAERASAEAAKALALAREGGYAGIEQRAAALIQAGSPAR